MSSAEFFSSIFSSDGMLFDFENIFELPIGVDETTFERWSTSNTCGVFGVPVTTCLLTFTVLVDVFIFLVADWIVEFWMADLSSCRPQLFDMTALVFDTVGGVVKSIKYIDLLFRPPGVDVVGDFIIANDADLFALYSLWSIVCNMVLDEFEIYSGVWCDDVRPYAADSGFKCAIGVVSDAMYEVSIICEILRTHESFTYIDSEADVIWSLSNAFVFFGVVKLHTSIAPSVSGAASSRLFSSLSSTNVCTPLFLLSSNGLSTSTEESRWSLQRENVWNQSIWIHFFVFVHIFLYIRVRCKTSFCNTPPRFGFILLEIWIFSFILLSNHKNERNVPFFQGQTMMHILILKSWWTNENHNELTYMYYGNHLDSSILPIGNAASCEWTQRNRTPFGTSIWLLVKRGRIVDTDSLLTNNCAPHLFEIVT